MSYSHWGYELTFKHIIYESEKQYVRITMNRPSKRNALSMDHLSELLQAFEMAGSSDAKGVVLAANGPVFSAGHDFSDMLGADLAYMRSLLTLCTKVVTTMQSIPQVVVAKVHALATAAGCQFVASADLAVASTNAAFATPGGKGGWFCHTPMVAVARSVGLKRAMEMAFTGDLIDASTACSWGLVNYVVEPDELESAVMFLLERATRGSAYSKGFGKEILYKQIGLSQNEAYGIALEAMAGSSQTFDAQEGMSAFLEKRVPEWKGR